MYYNITMKITGKYIVLSLSIIVVVALLFSSLYMKDLNERSKREFESNVKGLTDLSIYPKIVNIAPSSVQVDKVYDYSPITSVANGDGSSVIVELHEGPRWIFMENRRVFGIPGYTDIGDHKVTLRAYHGEIYSDYTFYINVYE